MIHEGKMINANKDSKIKMDFNLLMSGTWVLEKRGSQILHKFEKNIGEGKVIIYNALDVPSTLDSKVLDFLMLKAQENDWTKEIVTGSLRQIAREIGTGVDRRRLNRLKKSFKILVNTRIEFHNCFIDTGVMRHFEGSFEVIDIGILSSYSFKRIQGRGNPIVVKVVFDDNFLTLCKHSLGYKLVPYAPINGLRDTAYALYKWAWRWYDAKQGYGERWIGNGKKLVEWYKNELNSTGRYKYPSEVLRRIKRAIDQLNNHPEVPFNFFLQEENGLYRLILFHKRRLTLKKTVPFDTLPLFLKEALLNLVKEKPQIKNPLALVRSMTKKDIEKLLEKVMTVSIPKDVWDFITRDIIAKTHNKNEKREFEKVILSTNIAESDIIILFKESDFQRTKLISMLFDAFVPEWRNSLEKASIFLSKTRK